MNVTESPPSSSPENPQEDVDAGLLQGWLGHRSFRLAVQVITDLVIVMVSYWTAFWLRLDSAATIAYLPTIMRSLPIVVLVSLAAYKFIGVYRQIWHLAHIGSALAIVRATVLASMSAWIACIVIGVEPTVPRSVFPIYSMLSLLLIGSSRFLYRYALTKASSATRDSSRQRCLIYGAGMAGDLVARHFRANPRFPYNPIGFLDDDSNKRNRQVHGLRVLGTGSELGEICAKTGVSVVLIAMHSVPGAVIRAIVETCQLHGVKPLIVPDLANSIGQDLVRPRTVDIRDLLRRSPKLIDHDFLKSSFKGRTVFVSGAGGSIGSEICQQVLELEPETLLMIDSSEYNLYKIESQLHDLAIRTRTKCYYILGSVTDRALIERVFETHGPHFVLHAAAYKHVPIIESNPLQGVLNNIFGTKVLAETAIKFKVSRFLLISTDKAVRPTSVMGATKRCCELLVQALHRAHWEQTAFCAVRFGNVLGSSGSVVPRFLEQIQGGGPVTVTHADVTRYFMLVSEAVALVLQAISLSKGGEIFVLDMGEPVKIYEMAKQLIQLAGKVPGRDVEIEVTGLRPGEKLYEELILETSECMQVFGDLYVAMPDPVDSASVLESIEKILEAARKGDEGESVRMVRQMSQLVSRTEGEDFKADPVWDSGLH